MYNEVICGFDWFWVIAESKLSQASPGKTCLQ